MVAAAIFGGAALGAVGSAYAGSEAAGATRDASNAAVSQQQQALEQQKELSAPYRAIGEAAIPQYEALLGIGKDGSSGIQAALEQTPGYQFALSQGKTGIENMASAAGGVTGNTLAALDKYNVGLADSTYEARIGDISRAVGTGQAAAAGQAQNVGNAAGNIGNILTAQGQTMAGIDANTIAGITKSIGGAADTYTTLQTIKALQAQQTPSSVVEI